MPWDRVHDEAEVLEHVLSEELEELIAAKLGHPTHDPHGDPIPTPDLDDRRARTAALQRARGRRAGRLRARLGLRPRDAALPRRPRDRARRRRFEVVDKQPFDGPVFARFGERRARARRSAGARDAGGGRRRDAAGTASPTAPTGRRPPPRLGQRAPARCAPAGGVRGVAAAARPGLRRRGRLRRPGQLRHEHRRRREVRLPAAVGDPRREPHGDAHPDLSAKVGIATGRNLPELCREHFPRPVTAGCGSRPS